MNSSPLIKHKWYNSAEGLSKIDSLSPRGSGEAFGWNYLLGIALYEANVAIEGVDRRGLKMDLRSSLIAKFCPDFHIGSSKLKLWYLW
ncbi:hypothetical protein KY290_030765 [Solanum tuberosum]|uniref:Uncharacterized protein n=1 Tax=Solanum tuberosum TaxID=4113 RepID=A0ABQ7U932_SOLTU|nr:hypothetical protein KY289_030002 [Solanum tuberosum]KAH0742772.1 hypothetical protein KY290_030765 [Solanum tuberosum]